MSKNLLFALTLILVSSLANAAQVICEWNGLTCMNPTITPVTQLNEEFTVAGKPPNYIIGMISLNLWKSRPYLSYAPTKMFNIMPGIVYFGTSSSAPKMTLVTNSIANCSVMTHMEFLDANIGTIPEGFAQTCNNIRTLIIVRAGVDKVHKNAFKGMTKMEIMYMSDNKISCLPPELFQTLPNLIALDIPRLTLYHLKSHLQKYRLGKSLQALESCAGDSSSNDDNGNKKEVELEEDKEIQSTCQHLGQEVRNPSLQTSEANQSLQIAQALQMQMEVQRKLLEQIEVQKHLQLRIEAQGKYLHSVLKKAQETLSGYSVSSAMSIELAKSEISRLASIVNSGPTGSSFSELTELGMPEESDLVKYHLRGMCSTETSLTSSESSERNEEKLVKNENCLIQEKISVDSTELSHSNCTRKRNCDKILNEKDNNKLRKFESSIDLNIKYQNDLDLGPKAIDLNCHGAEQYSDCHL